jgi:outer membrane receptor protein involved in Fe transport
MLTIALLLSLAAGGPQAERRDSVVVTGVYEPVELDEADRAVALVEVEPRAALSSSVTGWLQLDSSVDLRQRAPAGVQADLSLRGGAFGQTLVLVDGVRVNDPQTGHHNLDLALPLGSISRIEILKGAGSTFYGSDAVGGAVNLVTRPPRASLVSLGAGVGSFGLNQQQAALSAVRRGVAQRFSFSRDFSRGFRPNRDYRSLALASQTNVSTPLGSAALTLGHADRPFGADRFYGNFGSWERTRTWFASLRQELGAATQATLGYRRHTDLFLLERYRPELYTNRHAAASYQASVRRRDDFGRNTTLHYGAETTADRIGSNNLGRHRRAGGAGYAALEVRALRRYSFSAGLREQYYGGGRWVASPSLAGGAWLTPALKIRASASHAYRLPTFTDLYYRDPATAGSPDLRPERAWSYERARAGGRGAACAPISPCFTAGRPTASTTCGPPPRHLARGEHQRLRFTGAKPALGGEPGARNSGNSATRRSKARAPRSAACCRATSLTILPTAQWRPGSGPSRRASPPGPGWASCGGGARPLRGAGSVPGVHQWPPAAISATDQPGQRAMRRSREWRCPACGGGRHRAGDRRAERLRQADDTRARRRHTLCGDDGLARRGCGSKPIRTSTRRACGSKPFGQHTRRGLRQQAHSDNTHVGACGSKPFGVRTTHRGLPRQAPMVCRAVRHPR